MPFINGGYTVTVEIADAFTITEAIIIDDVDLSWMIVTASSGSLTPISCDLADTESVFTIRNNGVGPTLNCTFTNTNVGTQDNNLLYLDAGRISAESIGSVGFTYDIYATNISDVSFTTCISTNSEHSVYADNGSRVSGSSSLNVTGSTSSGDLVEFGDGAVGYFRNLNIETNNDQALRLNSGAELTVNTLSINVDAQITTHAVRISGATLITNDLTIAMWGTNELDYALYCEQGAFVNVQDDLIINGQGESIGIYLEASSLQTEDVTMDNLYGGASISQTSELRVRDSFDISNISAAGVGCNTSSYFVVGGTMTATTGVHSNVLGLSASKGLLYNLVATNDSTDDLVTLTDSSLQLSNATLTVDGSNGACITSSFSVLVMADFSLTSERSYCLELTEASDARLHNGSMSSYQTYQASSATNSTYNLYDVSGTWT